MLIDRNRNFIFIHIYKTAGLSVWTALNPPLSYWQQLAVRYARRCNLILPFDREPYPRHIKAPELIDIIGKKAFDSYFSFAFIRNPWDWQVSLYKYMLKETTHHQHELAKSFGNFDNYIRWRCTEEVRFQKDFIYSSDGELLVDYVGRFENLETDFQTICTRIGIIASLPKLNVSNTTPYRQFYTDETTELVRKAFEPDITLFGYDF